MHALVVARPRGATAQSLPGAVQLDHVVHSHHIGALQSLLSLESEPEADDSDAWLIGVQLKSGAATDILDWREFHAQANVR
jgi:hypothetical protein